MHAYLELLPTRIAVLEKQVKDQDERLWILDNFKTGTNSFILQISERMMEAEKRILMLDGIPEMVKALERQQKREEKRVDRHEAFVNQFDNLEEYLTKIRILEWEIRKFDNIEQFVDKVNLMEREIKINRPRIDKIENDTINIWENVRRLSNELQKFDDIDAFLKSFRSMNIELNRIHTKIEILEKYGEEIKNIYKFNEQIQNNCKLMLEELKEEIDKKFRIADKIIQGNSIRLDNFEQIAEEMRRLKRKEPTMLELQKFEEKWKQNNEDIITKLRLLENALHNRTERILRLESFNADINNFGENSKRLRQFEKEWRSLGGIEELNKRLKNIELNTKTINLHEKEIQKFKLDTIRLSNENNTRIAGGQQFTGG
uniref:Uncharacterized protein n=1 Tax=Meloidogyne floridensis TaxID=298350 RepID=A0A915PBJ0_9BILA